MRFLRYFGIWTLIVIVFALQWHASDAMRGNTWRAGDYIRWSFVEFFTLALLAPGVLWLTARFPMEPRRLRHVPVHIVASLAFTGLALLLASFISHFTEPGHPSVTDQLSQFVAHHAATAMIAYWVFVTVSQARRFFREKKRRILLATQLQAELAQSCLQVLKMQLHPHFVFNTLHAIATLIRDDAAIAEDLLLRLSELLRVYLDDDRNEITLERELELLDLYLGIQRARFRDRLVTRVEAARSTLTAVVPSLILQPIVENAINHGIGRHAGSDCVEVSATRDADHLYLDVRNRNGSLDVAPEDVFARGIGLSNTRLRLKVLYGDSAGIWIDAAQPSGVCCRIRLPLRLRMGVDANGASLRA